MKQLFTLLLFSAISWAVSAQTNWKQLPPNSNLTSKIPGAWDIALNGNGNYYIVYAVPAIGSDAWKIRFDSYSAAAGWKTIAIRETVGVSDIRTVQLGSQIFVRVSARGSSQPALFEISGDDVYEPDDQSLLSLADTGNTSANVVGADGERNCVHPLSGRAMAGYRDKVTGAYTVNVSNSAPLVDFAGTASATLNAGTIANLLSLQVRDRDDDDVFLLSVFSSDPDIIDPETVRERIYNSMTGISVVAATGAVASVTKTETVTLTFRFSDGFDIVDHAVSYTVIPSVTNPEDGLVETPLGAGSVVVFPNPVVGEQVFVRVRGLRELEYVVISPAGEEAAGGRLPEGVSTITVAQLPAGVYVLRLISGEDTATLRFIVQ
jgi:hypothetical protein